MKVNRGRDIMANNDLYYLEALQKAFYEMFNRIHFHPNPKYPAEGRIFYIGFSDMSDYKYNIRVCKDFGNYDDDGDPIVATYSSMKELLLDGWRPD